MSKGGLEKGWDNMSHIKDRLTGCHDQFKKLAEQYEMISAKDVLDMIEQLQDDMEQDEKEILMGQNSTWKKKRQTRRYKNEKRNHMQRRWRCTA